MRATDLAISYPTVTMDTPALQAARLLAGHDLPGLIVIDAQGCPVVVLPGTQVLRLAVPAYCQDDPALARVIDEAAADVFASELGDRTVRQLLGDKPPELPVVTGRATLLELAALMARTHSPLAAVTGETGKLIGVVTLHRLLDQILIEQTPQQDA
jgi:CBS domain-containing protein